jgi:putative oxidoreductase
MDKRTVIAATKEIGIWIPTLLLAAIFFPQGISKFSETSGWVAAFRHWGYPDWFRMTVGAVEFLAAACLLWRRIAPVGALLIICVMIGGMATHVLDHHPRQVWHESVPLVLASIVLIARRKQLRQLLSQTSTSRASALVA